MVEKAPVAMDTGKVEDAGQENKGRDRVVWRSEEETIIDQALEEFKKKINSDVAKVAEKTVVDALELSAAERHGRAVRSVAPLAIRSIIDDVFDKV